VATDTTIVTGQASTERHGAFGDVVFRSLTLLFALLVLVVLGGVILSLVSGALPALEHFGLRFLVTEAWNPVTEKFGALAPVYGTLVTSAIAMLIGIPVAFGVALFITELCPNWLKRPLSTMIELLAAIPSIIYGIWGLFVLAPFVQEHIEPALIGTLEQAATREVAILQLQPDAEQRLLRLSAEARDREAMFEYLRRLGAAPGLAEVHLVSHQVQLEDPQRPIQFAVQARIREAQ